jgi:hypothetical protein
MPLYVLDETPPPTLHDGRSWASLVAGMIALTAALVVVTKFTIYR